MKKTLSAILALCMLICILPMAAAAETTTDNLLVNPSFEDGLTGWVCPDEKWDTVTNESGYTPQDGEYFAWPVYANRENTYIYQDVSLSGHKVGESLIFNVMICNFDQPPHDMGQIVVKFLDASGQTLKEHTQLQRNPNWNSQTIIAALPSGAVTARVELWSIWYVGGDVDAYFDDASVVLTTEKYSKVYITEKDGKETASEGDILYLTADNGTSKDPLDYTWSSSYELGATVNDNGIVTMLRDSEVAIYAKDKASRIVGIYWINSENENEKPAIGSGWASSVLAEADAMGLIPDCLVGADLTQQITRREFAAVAVKIYESLSGEPAAAAEVNPFTDCSDPEVLKAFNIGITNGTAADQFSPDVVLNREQLATMLTRIYKKVAISGWTLETDGSFDAQFKAMFTMPESFADDASISAFAKDSVYFMKAQGIIDGVGSNMFAPKHGTTADEAASYGLATREQALKIAVGMVENLR